MESKRNTRRSLQQEIEPDDPDEEEDNDEEEEK
jgi:transposase